MKKIKRMNLNKNSVILNHQELLNILGGTSLSGTGCEGYTDTSTCNGGCISYGKSGYCGWTARDPNGNEINRCTCATIEFI